MKYLMLLAIVLLAGCSSFDPEPYNIIHPTTTVTVEVDPMMGFMHEGEVDPAWGTGGGVTGEALVTPTTCHITLRDYPLCLAHEMRHCLEGPNWHPPMSATFPGNTDDCHQDGMYSQ